MWNGQVMKTEHLCYLVDSSLTQPSKVGCRAKELGVERKWVYEIDPLCLSQTKVSMCLCCNRVM